MTILQNEKVGKVVVKYEAAIKEVDVKLSVSGGDSGSKGPKKQKTEITIYTIRNGVVRPLLGHPYIVRLSEIEAHQMCPPAKFLRAMKIWQQYSAAFLAERC